MLQLLEFLVLGFQLLFEDKKVVAGASVTVWRPGFLVVFKYFFLVGRGNNWVVGRSRVDRGVLLN